MALQLLLYLNHKSINYILSHTCVRVHKTHRLAWTEVCTHAHGHTHTQSAHTIVGFIRCFTYFFLSLCFHFPSIYGKRQMDGEEGRAGEGGRVVKRTEGVFFFLSFFSESKLCLNLNSVLPYADLQRNVPYAQKFIKLYQRQTLNETKY